MSMWWEAKVCDLRYFSATQIILMSYYKLQISVGANLVVVNQHMKDVGMKWICCTKHYRNLKE